MTLSDMNPYVRFARSEESRFFPEDRIAYDHRLFFVERGSALFIIDGQEYRLEKDDAIYWPAGLCYRVVPDENSRVSGCNFDFIRKPYTTEAPLYPSPADQFTGKVVETPRFTDALPLNDVCRFRRTYGVREKLRSLYSEFSSRQLYFDHRCSALLKDVLMLCLRFCNREAASDTEKLTEQILSHIWLNFSEELTAEQFGELFHYHPNYISQLVKERTGLPLHRYIRSYRMHRALELLRSTNHSVTAIAAHVGMPDIHQFSKAFRQVIGYSPSSCRK